MQVLKLADMMRNYEGKWVALNDKRTEVVASGISLEQLLNLLKGQTAPKKPIISFVSHFDADYVG